MKQNPRSAPCKPVTGVVFFFIRAGGAALAMLAWVLAPNAPALAALITPYANVTVGWSDNVRLTSVPRSDFFIKAGPGLKGYWKWPEQELTLSGDVLYAQYFSLSDLSGFDSASLTADYKYNPSPRWTFGVNDRFSTSFEQAELDDTGEFVTIREGTGRIYRNNLALSLKHRYSSFNSIQGSYYNTYTKGEDDTQENTVYHRLNFAWNHRLSYQHSIDVGASGVRTDYEDSPDEDRYRVYTRLTRFMGPSQQIWAEASYTVNRTVTETDLVGNARDYNSMALNAGLTWAASKRLNGTFSAGWAYVTGDSPSNDAANRGFPLLNADINYKGKRWSIRGYAVADLGQFDYLGDNSGLAIQHRAGVNWRYDFARRQSFSLTAEYSRNDYMEDPLEADTSQQGIVNSYRLIASWNWQIHRHWRITLQYSYLNRDAEADDDDRQQNQVLLMLYTDYPFRW